MKAKKINIGGELLANSRRGICALAFSLVSFWVGSFACQPPNSASICTLKKVQSGFYDQSRKNKMENNLSLHYVCRWKNFTSRTQALWSELLFPQISLLTWLLLPPHSTPWQPENPHPNDFRHPTLSEPWRFFVLLKIKKQFPSPQPESLAGSLIPRFSSSINKVWKIGIKQSENCVRTFTHYQFCLPFSFLMSQTLPNQHPNRTPEWHLKNK